MAWGRQVMTGAVERTIAGQEVAAQLPLGLKRQRKAEAEGAEQAAP